MISIPTAARLKALAAVQAVQLDGGSLRLFQNDFTPVKETVLADFTVADFSGYANLTIATWDDPFLDPNGVAVILGGLVTFAANAATVANTIYGWYYVDADGAYAMGERFDTPVGFAKAGDTLNFVPKFTYGESTPVI